MTVEVYRGTVGRRCDCRGVQWGDVTVEVYRGTVGRRCDCRGVQGHRGEEM